MHCTYNVQDMSSICAGNHICTALLEMCKTYHLFCIQETIQAIVPCAAPENVQEMRHFLDTGHVSEV